MPSFTAAMYDGPLPEEWIETVGLDLDTYLLEPGPGTAFRLGATVAVVAQESDHDPETLIRYIVRDVADRMDSAQLQPPRPGGGSVTAYPRYLPGPLRRLMGTGWATRRPPAPPAAQRGYDVSRRVTVCSCWPVTGTGARSACPPTAPRACTACAAVPTSTTSCPGPKAAATTRATCGQRVGRATSTSVPSSDTNASSRHCVHARCGSTDHRIGAPKCITSVLAPDRSAALDQPKDDPLGRGRVAAGPDPRLWPIASGAGQWQVPGHIAGGRRTGSTLPGPNNAGYGRKGICHVWTLGKARRHSGRDRGLGDRRGHGLRSDPKLQHRS